MTDENKSETEVETQDNIEEEVLDDDQLEEEQEEFFSMLNRR